MAPSSGAEARGAKTRGQIGKILLLGWTRSTNKSMIKRLKRKIREGRLLVVPAQSRVRARNRFQWNLTQGQVFKAGPEGGNGEKGPTSAAQLKHGPSLDPLRHALVFWGTGGQEEGNLGQEDG